MGFASVSPGITGMAACVPTSTNTRSPEMVFLPPSRRSTSSVRRSTKRASPRNRSAPLAIVWLSALAEAPASVWKRIAIAAGLAGYGAAIWSIHPYELTYFNELAGGSLGGRQILADSNLDWGQGLKSLARLQQERTELCDLTLYYFGDTDPARYHVVGRSYVVNAVDDHSRVPSLATVDSAWPHSGQPVRIVPLFTDEDLADRFVASDVVPRHEAGGIRAVRLVSWDSGAVILDDQLARGATHVAFDLADPDQIAAVVASRPWAASGVSAPARVSIKIRARTRVG